MTLNVTGGTRAGLLSAAVQAVFRSAFPEDEPVEESEVRNERPFSLQAETFPALFAALIDASLESARANGEAIEGVKFTLATDKKATGAFLGLPREGYVPPDGKASVDGSKLQKNVEGRWEAELTIE